jgi:hypothetical protein
VGVSLLRDDKATAITTAMATMTAGKQTYYRATMAFSLLQFVIDYLKNYSTINLII